MPGCKLIRITAKISDETKKDLSNALKDVESADCIGIVIEVSSVETRDNYIFDMVLDTARKLKLNKHEVRFVGLSGDTRITFFNSDKAYGFDLGFNDTIESACETIRTFKPYKGRAVYFL
jgi:anti-anti-sigma regulatory factor